jgi:hypothetical protein
VKRWRTTLIVAGVFGALLVYVLLVEGKRDAPEEPRPGVTPSPTPVPVLDIAVPDILSLEVTDGERTLRIAHEGDAWRIVQPVDAPVDAAALAWPLGEIAQLEARLIVADEVTDLATYGLDTPSLTVTIASTGGTAQLRAGRQTPGGSAYYVLVEGDPRLYTVDPYTIDNLRRWLDEPPYAPTPTPETAS